MHPSPFAWTLITVVLSAAYVCSCLSNLGRWSVQERS